VASMGHREGMYYEGDDEHEDMSQQNPDEVDMYDKIKDRRFDGYYD
jgi:hypothetical protein